LIPHFVPEQHSGILKSEANRDVQQEDGGKGKSASPIVGTNEEEKSGGETETDWVFCSENAYGAFIYVGITETVGRAVIRCGPMVLASVGGACSCIVYLICTGLGECSALIDHQAITACNV